MPDDDRFLDEAARLWGIEPEYWDIWGRLHVTPPETKRAILTSLGVTDCAQAIEERRRGEWLHLLPPCVVTGRAGAIPVTVTEEEAEAQAEVEIRLEDGGARRVLLSLAALPAAERAELDGRPRLRKLLPLEPGLPLGYHELRLSLAGRTATAQLILTPERAYAAPRRGAGIVVPLYGLRSQRNWGCGDFTDLRALLDWAAEELGASFIGLNPLHAIPNRRPFNTSPYLPQSVFYQNFIYLDVEAIEDFRLSARAAALWAAEPTRREVEALRAAEFVEYERVAALKLRFLKIAFGGFLRQYRRHAPAAAGFRAFLAREGEPLELFALYCALDEQMRACHPDVWIWPDWPEPYRRPDTPEVEAFRRKHWRRVLFYQWVQWHIDCQLAACQEHARRRGLAIGLYHDLALAIDRFGADFWAYRPFFVSGCRVGSPPDDFAPQGQDWGFPPPRSEAHGRDCYRLFTDTVRKNCRHGGALRIDHVMRFFRLYWIPDGADAAGGAYVRDQWEDYLRILALESVRNQVALIGEDLGTVEPAVREALARFGILSYRLFYFEKDAQGRFRSPSDYPEQALVSSTTHDLPTLAGFWSGRDIEARRAAGLLGGDHLYQAQKDERVREKQKMLDLLHDLRLLPPAVPRSVQEVPELTGDLHNAIIGFLALTPSLLLAVNQEDLTKETEQQNLPGTTSQYPNWARKMRFSLEDLRSEKLARDFGAMFRFWLRTSGREN